jgi:hypothetical protein
MTREILEKQKEKLHEAIDRLCDDIIACENDKLNYERLLENLCHISSCANAQIIPELVAPIIGKERIIKWLKTLKPLLGFRFFVSAYDDIEIKEIELKKGKRELNIYLHDDSILFAYDSCDEYIFGCKQFVYSLFDRCRVDTYDHTGIVDRIINET